MDYRKMELHALQVRGKRGGGGGRERDKTEERLEPQ